MLHKCKTKLKSRAGFSLSEVLIAVLILLLVAGIVAEGVPVALNAYHRVVNASNAQVLLSTTMTKLRTELSTAKDVKVEGTTVSFTAPNGIGSEITLNPPEEADKGIYLVRTVDETPNRSLLVSRAAANKGSADSGKNLKYLYVTFAAFDDNSYKDGIITFKNLAVTDGENTLADIDQYQIRVLTDPAS